MTKSRALLFVLVPTLPSYDTGVEKGYGRGRSHDETLISGRIKGMSRAYAREELHALSVFIPMCHPVCTARVCKE